MQDWNLEDKFAGLSNVGQENDGLQVVKIKVKVNVDLYSALS